MASAMEMDESTEFQSLWDKLKTYLDFDIPPGDAQQVLQLIGKKLPRGLEVNLPSKMLVYLENNYSTRQCLSIIKHVLGEMEYHHYHSGESYVSKIEELERMQMNESFVGRTEELGRILDMMSSSTLTGCWIYGESGLGKTSLADEVCSRVESKFSLIKLKLSECSSFGDLLISLLHGMNHITSDTLEQQLMDTLFQNIQTLQKDTGTLIVFDTMEKLYEENKHDVESFIEKLIGVIRRNGKTKIKLLFTSQLVLEECPSSLQLMHLKPLRPEDARQLFMMLMKPVELTEEVLQSLCCSRSPQMLRFLSMEFHHLHALGVDISLDVVEQSVSSIHVLVQYAVGRLDEDSQTLMAMLMIFETSAFSIDDAAVVADKPRVDLVMALSDLTNRNMLQECSQPRYEEKDHQNLFWYKIHRNVLLSLRETLLNHVHQYQHVQHDAKTRFCRANLEQFEQKLHNFDMFYESAVRFITKSKSRIEVLFNCLSDAASDLNMSDGQLRVLNHINPICMSYKKRDEMLQKVANSYRERDPMQQSYWIIQRANMYLEINQITEAEEMLKEIEDYCLRFLDPQHRAHAVLIVEFLLTKGRILKENNKYSDALEYERKCLDILQHRIGNDIPREAAVYNGIGNIFFKQGKYDESLLNHKTSVELMESYVKEDASLDLSIYTFNLGTIAYVKACKIKCYSMDDARKSCLEALVYYDRSIEIDRALKQDQLSKHAEKIKIRARAYRLLKDYERAISDAKKSVEILERVLEGGPREAVILGYFQVGELYQKYRQNLLKHKGTAISTDRDRRLLEDSWLWLKKAATEIYETREVGLDPKHEESPAFANIYKEVGLALSDTLGKMAEKFATEFLSGTYYRPESPESVEGDGIGSSDTDESVDIMFVRRDSGLDSVEGSVSSSGQSAGRTASRRLEGSVSSSGQSTSRTASGRFSLSEDVRQHSITDEVFLESDEHQANTPGNRKRKSSDD